MRLWYFIVDHQQSGPVPEVELRARLAGGRLDQRTWVWTEGMSAWTMVAYVEGLGDGSVVHRPGEEVDPRALPPVPDEHDAWFLHLGMAKLLFLLVTTAGMFQADWIDWNWRHMRARDRDAMRPGWRNGFHLFRLPILLKRIRDDAHLKSTCPPTFSPAILFTVWTLLVVAGCIAMLVVRTHLVAIFAAMMFTSSLCLLPAQAAVNRANRARTPRPRETRIPGGYWFSLAFVLAWALILLLD